MNVQILGCSVDSKFSHKAWREVPRAEGGLGDLNYPLLTDLKKEISTAYDVLLDAAGISLRGLFLIDKDGVVRNQVVNDLPLGRSVDEALRMVKALQHHEQHGEVCPANWNEGARGLDPAKSKEFFQAEYGG